MIIEAPIIKELKTPIFLAGPIQGTHSWQTDACNYIQYYSGIDIANPRRNEWVKTDFDYSEQVEWECKYLNQAAHEGVILFWLAAEKEHHLDRCYAQTTRFELAEWYTKSLYEKDIKIVIGIEDGFPGARYIKYRTDLPIYETLAETCQSAIKIIENRENSQTKER
jgi:hypothetical protein